MGRQFSCGLVGQSRASEACRKIRPLPPLLLFLRASVALSTLGVAMESGARPWPWRRARAVVLDVVLLRAVAVESGVGCGGGVGCGAVAVKLSVAIELAV